MICKTCNGKGLVKYSKPSSAFGPAERGMKPCPSRGGTGKSGGGQGGGQTVKGTKGKDLRGRG